MLNFRKYNTVDVKQKQRSQKKWAARRRLRVALLVNVAQADIFPQDAP